MGLSSQQPNSIVEGVKAGAIGSAITAAVAIGLRYTGLKNAPHTPVEIGIASLVIGTVVGAVTAAGKQQEARSFSNQAEHERLEVAIQPEPDMKLQSTTSKHHGKLPGTALVLAQDR